MYVRDRLRIGAHAPVQAQSVLISEQQQSSCFKATDVAIIQNMIQGVSTWRSLPTAEYKVISMYKALYSAVDKDLQVELSCIIYTLNHATHVYCSETPLLFIYNVRCYEPLPDSSPDWCYVESLSNFLRHPCNCQSFKIWADLTITDHRMHMRTYIAARTCSDSVLEVEFSSSSHSATKST